MNKRINESVSDKWRLRAMALLAFMALFGLGLHGIVAASGPDVTILSDTNGNLIAPTNFFSQNSNLLNAAVGPVTASSVLALDPANRMSNYFGADGSFFTGYRGTVLASNDMNGDEFWGDAGGNTILSFNATAAQTSFSGAYTILLNNASILNANGIGSRLDVISNTQVTATIGGSFGQPFISVSNGVNQVFAISSNGLVTAGQLGGWQALSTNAIPIGVIYDDSINTDPDYGATFPFLFNLQRLGVVNVLAVTTGKPQGGTNWPGYIGIQAAKLFGDYYGSAGTAYGCATNTTNFSNVGQTPTSSFASYALTNFTLTIPTPPVLGPPPNVSLAVAQYRNLLASASNPVVMVFSGGLDNLGDLLVSPADVFSSQTGAQLVSNKCRVVSIMAGDYPNSAQSGGAEHNLNILSRPDSISNVMTFFPTNVPLLWTGYSFGTNVSLLAQPWQSLIDPASPADVVMSQNMENWSSGGYSTVYSGELGRPFWNAAALFAGVTYGVGWQGTNYFTPSAPGTNYIYSSAVYNGATSGSNQFRYVASANQYWLTNGVSFAVLSNVMNRIITMPAPESGRGTAAGQLSYENLVGPRTGLIADTSFTTIRAGTIWTNNGRFVQNNDLAGLITNNPFTANTFWTNSTNGGAAWNPSGFKAQGGVNLTLAPGLGSNATATVLYKFADGTAASNQVSVGPSCVVSNLALTDGTGWTASSGLSISFATGLSELQLASTQPILVAYCVNADAGTGMNPGDAGQWWCSDFNDPGYVYDYSAGSVTVTFNDGAPTGGSGGNYTIGTKGQPTSYNNFHIIVAIPVVNPFLNFTVTTPALDSNSLVLVTNLTNASVAGSWMKLDHPPLPVDSYGLIGWWPLNEGTGATTADASGNGFTGTLTSTSWTTGNISNALSFNGSSSCVSLGNVSFPATNWSVAAWFNTTSASAPQFILAQGGGSGLNVAVEINSGLQAKINLDGYPIQTLASGSAQIGSTTSITANVWNHVVVTWDGLSMRLYLNGSLKTTDVFPNSATGSGYLPMVIGGRVSQNANWFTGKIQGVRAYNRVLPLAEVQAIYATGGQ